MVDRYRSNRVSLIAATSRCALLALVFLNISVTFAEQYEPRLIEGLESLQTKNTNNAEQSISGLIKDYPNSQAAHLMMSELYAARAGVLSTNDENHQSLSTKERRQLTGLRDELRLRWKRNRLESSADSGLIPAQIIQLSPSKKTLVYVDAATARLYLFANQNGVLSIFGDHYATIGEKGTHKRLEGDKKTPIGVYHVTEYIDGKTLPPLYGSGAFPINYPNVLDKHHQRTGYGIWIHGTHPESFNRIPLASDGCVAMSNPEFDIIRPHIQSNRKTPVIISELNRWVAPEKLQAKRALFHHLLARWERDWESLDAARYFSHYDADHSLRSKADFKRWADKQTALFSRQSQLNLEISELSLFDYPGETDIVVAQFTQNYLSNERNTRTEIEQYWRRDAADEWKIIYEARL